MNDKNIAQKAFENPQFYRNFFLNTKLIKNDKSWLSGKTFICIHVTRFCPVGCKFCFFKSGKMFRQPTREDIFTEEGMEKFVNFANNINLALMRNEWVR